MPTGDPYKIVATGDKITMPRDWRNGVSRATEAYNRSRNVQTSGPIKTFDPEGCILCRNNSGAAVQRFGVLGIDSILISDQQNLLQFENLPAIKGITPAIATHRGKFVVCAEPIPSGNIGRAFVFGVCPVQVNVITAGDPFAEVTNADATQLTSGPFGLAQILWAAAGTGKKWALVRLAAAMSPEVVVQLTSVVSSAGGKYNGTIYGGVMNDNGTGNLSLPDGLTAGQSCLVLNQDEQGQPTHWAIVGSSYNYAAGVYWGMSTEATPRPTILIRAPNIGSAARRHSAAQARPPTPRHGTERLSPPAAITVMFRSKSPCRRARTGIPPARRSTPSRATLSLPPMDGSTR